MKKHVYPLRLLPSLNHKKMVIDRSFDDYYVLNYMKNDKPFTSIENVQQDIDNQMESKRFVSGMSVSLAVNYNKGEHSKKVEKNPQRDYFGNWKEGEKAIRPFESDVTIIEDRGWFGFKIADVVSVRANYEITNEKKTVLRTDKTQLIVEHCPTYSNFWHCQLEVYGTNSKTNVVYKASDRDTSNYSRRQIENAGAQLVRILRDQAKTPDEIEYKYVHAGVFMKELGDKREYKRFKKY